MMWQPIESAPKDGTPIVLWNEKYGAVEGLWGQVDGGGHPENGDPVYWWTSTYVEFLDGQYDAPTLWCHLPDPPLPNHQGQE